MKLLLSGAIPLGSATQTKFSHAGSTIDPDRAEKIRSRLLENADVLEAAIAQSETLGSKFEGSQLVAVDDADYNVIREVYRGIGNNELVEE